MEQIFGSIQKALVSHEEFPGGSPVLSHHLHAVLAGVHIIESYQPPEMPTFLRASLTNQMQIFQVILCLGFDDLEEST